MRVLVACEFSGIVRDAFAAKGHDAWSCDLLPSERNGNHLQQDVLGVLDQGWDLMIAHPPCTHLAASGARWWKDKQAEQVQAIEFVHTLTNAPIKRIAIENPIGILSRTLGEPDQIIQPYWFGHAETKATCLWLYDLPTLKSKDWISSTKVEDKIHREPPSANRWKNRSRTYLGIAAAMAEQWS